MAVSFSFGRVGEIADSIKLLRRFSCFGFLDLPNVSWDSDEPAKVLRQISQADNFEEEGVEWVRANKTAGSRVTGATLICDRLEASIEASDNERMEIPIFHFKCKM